MKPRITICICTYNRYDVLPKAIESAKEQSIDKSMYRIVVVDNSPDHEKAAQVGKHYHSPPFLDYRIEKTPGLSNARNVGAKECGTEFIAFMDDDAIASKDWLKNLLYGFDSFGKDVSVVGGRVDPIWEIARPLWLGDQLVSYVSVVDWGGEPRIAAPNEWFAGTNIAFHTKTILDAGGFDVKLGRIGGGATLLSNEEIVIMNHLREQGKNAVYVPEASVRHLVERKRLTHTWFRKRAAWQAVSDFMANPAHAQKMALKAWDWTMGYFFKLPPNERTIRGIYLDTDSPELFKRQLDAHYVITAMLLAGFDGVSEIEKGLGAGVEDEND